MKWAISLSSLGVQHGSHERTYAMHTFREFGATKTSQGYTSTCQHQAPLLKPTEVKEAHVKKNHLLTFYAQASWLKAQLVP